jgi:hypothetical protein
VRRRGPFAFHYAPELSEQAIAWYGQFDLLVTHDPLPPDQVARLHDAGTRLLVYEWSVAFYDGHATRWQRSLTLRDVLNAAPLTGGSGSGVAGAWYFDPVEMRGRAAAIVERLEATGYDGIFLDTTRFENVHPEAQREFARRHGESSYDAAFARFLVDLRGVRSDIVLFTNQGYRSAEHYLPHVDWDLTESLFTRPRNGAHEPRAWNDPGDPWNSVHFVMKQEIEPIVARYPGVRFGHLNYVSGRNPELIRSAVAVAHLFDSDAYTVAASLEHEIDPIYFRDPGRPLAPRVDAEDGQAAFRLFEDGLILVGESVR